MHRRATVPWLLAEVRSGCIPSVCDRSSASGPQADSHRPRYKLPLRSSAAYAGRLVDVRFPGFRGPLPPVCSRPNSSRKAVGQQSAHYRQSVRSRGFRKPDVRLQDAYGCLGRIPALRMGAREGQDTTRSEADIAGREGGRPIWADCGPSGVAREGRESLTKRTLIFTLGGRFVERVSAAAPCHGRRRAGMSDKSKTPIVRVSLILLVARPSGGRRTPPEDSACAPSSI